MDSNHEWQRHQALSRVSSRRREAEAARMVREARGESARVGFFSRLLRRLGIRKPVIEGEADEVATPQRVAQPIEERI